MKTIKKVVIIPVFVETIPEAKSMEKDHVYISESYLCAVHLCLCGCGREVVLPLNKGQWLLTKSEKGVSFSPSVGNYSFDCKSHYIITNNIANFV